MSHDTVADGLNQILNAKRARKDVVKLKHYSKLLISVLAIAKLRGYILDYKLEDKSLVVKIGTLIKCGPVKPRYMVTVGEIEDFTKIYLPSKNMGLLIISTSKGLMTHTTAIEKNIGGSLIAYIY